MAGILILNTTVIVIYLLDIEGRCIAKQPSEGESYEDRYYCFKYAKDIKAELQRISDEYNKNKENNKFLI